MRMARSLTKRTSQTSISPMEQWRRQWGRLQGLPLVAVLQAVARVVLVGRAEIADVADAVVLVLAVVVAVGRVGTNSI